MTPSTNTLETVDSNPPKKVSYLISLPAELRNIIYNFTFPTTSSLVYKTPSRYEKRGILYEANIVNCSNTQAKEYNQLKYANRQLYKETADLELIHNEITFQQNFDWDDTPVEQLYSFTNTLLARKLHWLTRIVLRPSVYSLYMKDDHTNLVEAIDSWEKVACRFEAYPQLAVKYVLSTFQSSHATSAGYIENAESFILSGIEIAMAIRKYDPSYALSPPRFIPWKDQLRWDETIELERRLPNFRIFPNQTEIGQNWILFAAKQLCDTHESGHSLCRWILLAKEWIERGI
ncbi:uncharacterized protein K460DRAFT_415146 [Cucurbitaria berberidis CBS 394.84]|uniref:F-box domain-containing protein n=1 Tax=Cucurbitaria berberidis CBS 394.84 TaxID=1168544 RepID=A0A9P4GN39_9PLEO|nr:uncharacterized protein K460DRAFT_415146 [Cucurbitaria berberidis CBS 394.84]KAF1848610.1 hypothetical protein K460DRAFT_415146 [Cucurbitaria berberidis CBS 394.84]